MRSGFSAARETPPDNTGGALSAKVSLLHHTLSDADLRGGVLVVSR
jgi:hypothetical protein